MAIYNLTFNSTALPADWSGTLEEFRQAILASLTATISTDNIVNGQVGGSPPVSDIGPWFNDGQWYYYNTSVVNQYIPVPVSVGDPTSPFVVSLGALLSSDKSQTFQDADGVIALTSDVYTPRATQTLTGSSPFTMDFSLSNSFKLTTSANFTLKITNDVPGQITQLAVVNSGGGAITPTMPANVRSVSIANIAAGKTDVFVFRNVGGTIYAEQLAGYA